MWCIYWICIASVYIYIYQRTDLLSILTIERIATIDFFWGIFVENLSTGLYLILRRLYFDFM